jgi:putative ABC transport system permease protein
VTGRFVGLAAVAWRESRTARRRLLLYMSSITLGVAALVAIDSFAANVTRAVHEQARALLGGDLSLIARDRFPAPVAQLLDSLSGAGVGVARQTSFASMAVVTKTSAMRLVQVRAVTTPYPFYGEIGTAPAGAWATLGTGPDAVVDSSLLVALNARVGDTLSLGLGKFVIRGAIVSVPGEVAVAAAVGPRVYMPARYLPETGLLVFGSRADYEVLIKLPATLTTGQFQGRYGPLLSRNRVRVHTVAQNEYNLSEAIDQLRNFLGVVGLVALLLGGIGVASGVHAFVMRKIDTVAVLRCLGATSGQVVVIYVMQAAVMGLVGAVAGAALGVAMQFAMPNLARDFLPVGASAQVAPRALFSGLAIGVWVALVFALRPLLALRRVSPLQALRRETDAAVLRRARRDSAASVVSLAIVASVFALTLVRSDRWQDGVGFSVAVFVAVAALWVVALVLAYGARRFVRPSWPFVVRHAVASLHRPGNQTRAVILSLGFGVFLMSTLYQAQHNLVAQLNLRLEQLHANVAFFDVQGDQAAAVDSIIRASRNELLQRVPVVPMRIAAIGGRNVATLFGDTTQGFGSGDRARQGGPQARRRPGWALRREYRVTYRDTLVAWERIAAGQWFHASNDTMPEVSLDSSLASGLRVSIGDTITWDVQGVRVATRVTSFREVTPSSRFQPNFSAVFSPRALASAPQQVVFLVHAPNARAVAELQREVIRRYPNVSSLDLTLVQQTVSNVLTRVTTAIRFMALVSLLLGVPVLFSAVAATRRERLREGVLFKTLGGTRRQVGQIMLAEYALLGGLGSLAGVVLSIGSAWALLHFLFKTTFSPAVLPALIVSAAMTLLAVLIGLLTSRDVFASTPMAALREV